MVLLSLLLGGIFSELSITITGLTITVVLLSFATTLIIKQYDIFRLFIIQLIITTVIILAVLITVVK